MVVDLTGKNILVTGASRGIGKAITEQLLLSGAKVAAHYNSTPVKLSNINQELLDNLVPIKADLGNSAQTAKLFAAACKKLGRIDVLINNAGIALKCDPGAPDFVEKWEATMAVNLRAVGILCTAATNHFISNRGGIIINISSRAAFRGDTADYLAYAASKGGIVALTRSIARAYGKQGIVAFNVAPGFVKTDMADEFIEAYGEGIVKDDIALVDLTQPKDLAPLITLLASGMANHATGGTFDVNAGSYVH
jgi:NAD(P)-dependent dehydrogenase (short-subunit alcohol dehydrogenase family)